MREAENKQEMAEIVSRRQWFNVPVSDIIGRIRGEINYGNGRRVTDPRLAMKFWGASGEVSYPWKSLDTWFITENIALGQVPANTDVKALVDRTTRATSGRPPPKRSASPTRRQATRAASRPSSTG